MARWNNTQNGKTKSTSRDVQVYKIVPTPKEIRSPHLCNLDKTASEGWRTNGISTEHTFIQHIFTRHTNAARLHNRTIRR